MSGLSQNFVHASLVNKCDKSETPRQKKDKNYNTALHPFCVKRTIQSIIKAFVCLLSLLGQVGCSLTLSAL